jgi:site-specific recombinase
MIRAATPKGILDIVGWLLLCLLMGSLAGRIAKYFGAPMEIRVLAFVAMTAISMTIWYVGRKSEAKAS